ncbi:MAG: helix-turn-helix domain-containing protein [Succinivibrio sp.]
MPRKLIQAAKEMVNHGPRSFPLACYENKTPESKNELYEAHWHQEVEIIFCDEGVLELGVDSNVFSLKAPAIAIIPSKLVHILNQKAGSSQRYLLFKSEIINLAYYDQFIYSVIDSLSDSSSGVMILDSKPDNYATIKECSSFIFANCNKRDAEKRFECKVNLLKLILELKKAGLIESSRSGSDFEITRHQRFKDLLNWIREHHSGPLTVTDAATRMNFSEAYFCRYFKKTTRMSFTEYVNDYRLEQAGDEILEGKKTLSEIAASHGFENESYFFRLFKKKYGMTPLEYKKR